jgi:hypothetical protein
MSKNIATCDYCDLSDPSFPLLLFKYHGYQNWIHPQYLPIPTHRSDQFAYKLPSLEFISLPGGHS